MLEKERLSWEKDSERTYTDRERQDFRRSRVESDDSKRGRVDFDDSKRGRMDADDSKRGRIDSDDSTRRGRSEFEGRHRTENDRMFSGCEPRLRHSKYTTKDASDASKHRERHKVHPRSRRSESPPFRDSTAKGGNHTRGDGRKQGRNDW